MNNLRGLPETPAGAEGLRQLEALSQRRLARAEAPVPDLVVGPSKPEPPVAEQLAVIAPADEPRNVPSQAAAVVYLDLKLCARV